jgi:transcriptional regulator with XRE-family HTH domain
LTQRSVASAAAISPAALSRYERGVVLPELDALRRIAAALNEDVLVCFQSVVGGELERDLIAPL